MLFQSISGRAAPGTQKSSAFLVGLDLSTEDIKYGIDILKRKSQFQNFVWEISICWLHGCPKNYSDIKTTNTKKVIL